MADVTLPAALPRRALSPAGGIVALGLLLAAALLLGLAIGPVRLDLGETIAALFSEAADPRHRAIVWQLRLPRSLMAAMVGSGLAVSGVLLQGLFRNPMADPGLIGVTAGASLAAAVTIILSGAILPLALLPYALPLAAFGGGLAVTAFVYRFALVEGRTAIAVLLLAGIAINSLCLAGIGFMNYLGDDRQLRDISFWMLGSMAGASWTKLGPLLPCALLPLALAPWLARGLDALNLGEREAGHLGIPVERLKRTACLAAALAAGGAVAFSGLVPFVGLILPHLLRLLFGPGHRLLLPAAALGGASLAVLADLVARTIAAPAELPVGLLTSLLGAPFFLALLLRARREFAA